MGISSTSIWREVPGEIGDTADKNRHMNRHGSRSGSSCRSAHVSSVSERLLDSCGAVQRLESPRYNGGLLAPAYVEHIIVIRCMSTKQVDFLLFRAARNVSA